VSIDATTLLAIFAMALATYATRLGGLYLMRGILVRGRSKAALDAVPPAILMAVIAPTVLATGPAESLASLITAGAALLKLPLAVTILIGIISVLALRALIG